MSEQNTPVAEPKQGTQPKDSVKGTDDWEKRYKDLQAEFTKKSQHEKELQQQMQDLNTNYEQLAGYISQQQQPQTNDSDYDFVSKKELSEWERRVAKQIEATNLASEFRSKYPDMVQYEDMVAYYLENKTDKRHTLKDRMESAVTSAKSFLDAERQRGIELAKQAADAKAAEEAQASGLSYETTPPGSGAPSAETGQEYLAWRKQRSAKKRGYTME
jgi:hypothetical protein